MATSNSALKSKECGCKGVRSCLLCRNSKAPFSATNLSPADSEIAIAQEVSTADKFIYHYCLHCDKAWLKESQSGVKTSNFDDGVWTSQPCSHNGEAAIELLGIHIIENFVNQDEVCILDEAISCTPFKKSQSGRQKQDFGPKVNFKKQKLKLGSFNGLPSYSRFLYQRMKDCKLLEKFEPVEMCNLEYTSDRGAHIDPHFDDAWIWGERLVTLNLLSDSVLSFTHDSHPDIVVLVPLLRRSLIVVSGPARYEWKHAIDSQHISGRRLAMTFRELSDEFKLHGVRSEEGHELLKVALSFEGCAIGCN